jgi:hypothetical protein
MKIFKQIISLTVLTFVCLFSYAQKQADWKEMHDFHAVMSKSFHPAEENNFKPLKQHADSIVIVAKAWQASIVPVGFNGAVPKPILEKLVKQTEIVQTAVKQNKSDAELKKLITEAHDIFHEIMEKCRDEKK